MILSNFTDIVSYNMNTSDRSTEIILDCIHPKDILISYFFDEEKLMLDCIR
jgi:hypothetical protein